MTLAIIILLAAAVIGFGTKPAFAALDRIAARKVESLVEPVLGPQVDWDAAQRAWESQGKSQLR